MRSRFGADRSLLEQGPQIAKRIHFSRLHILNSSHGPLVMSAEDKRVALFFMAIRSEAEPLALFQEA